MDEQMTENQFEETETIAEETTADETGTENAESEEGAKKKKKKKPTPEMMLSVLDKLYEKSLDGVPIVDEKTIEEFANEYLQKYGTVEKAAKALVRAQIIKCTTTGFVTGLGGILTLPVAIPTNIGVNWYVQMRMVAALAHMGGLDLQSDEVKTLIYACLAGVSVATLVKQFGKEFAEILTKSMILKIPKSLLSAINRKVGVKLVTKVSEKGFIVLVKAAPIVGGFVGSGFDFASTRAIAKRAYQLFIQKTFDTVSADATAPGDVIEDNTDTDETST